jgi:iron(III) transport system ATP-binding protein
MSQPLLHVSEISKRFDVADGPVVEAVSLTVDRGEILALLGPSGCGKTTTLRLIAGLERLDAGTISLDGQMLADGENYHRAPHQRGIGVVFQDYALFPHLNVLENITFGLRSGSREANRARAMEMVRLVGLGDLTHRYPHELSGGQQQRVALARTLAPAPRLVLLDEPFSSLDALLRQQTREEVRQILQKAGATAILVTHDQEEALSFADRVAVMRKGGIDQVGTPEEVYYGPKTLFIAQFLGRTNLMLAQAAGATAMSPLGSLELNRPAEGNVLISLRPEHVYIRTACEGDPSGEVLAREFRGHDITYRVNVDGMEYLAHTPNDTHFQIGDRVCLEPAQQAVVLQGQKKPTIANS